LIKLNLMNKSEISDQVPVELINLLKKDNEANDFFVSLSAGYKKGYCEWVGSAKQESTRQVRAEKAVLMLRNKQKTLKTV
jgi:uncharacterized protein YdeI (YjbR/CyaY-like superfamily)